MDLRHAIEKSCNVYFYTLGNMLGVDKIHKWAEKLGLVRQDRHRPAEREESLVPSTEWKQQRTGEQWYPGETISVAIGQGQVSVTPMSLAVMMSTVANGGTRVTPHLVKAVDEGSGLEAGAAAGAVADTVRVQARDAVGAARRAVDGRQRRRHRRPRRASTGRDVAGKTGTAQVISIQGRQRARKAPTRTCATTAGSCSSRRATTRRSPA